MDTYEEMYKTVCRVCLLKSDSKTMVSLTDNTNEKRLNCYAKSITILTSISFEKEGGLPDRMCQNCAFLLKQAIRFKLLCDSSDKKLKLLQKNVRNNNKKIQEVVCEYVMFNEYFSPETTRNEIKTLENKPKTEPQNICYGIDQNPNRAELKNNDSDDFSRDSDDCLNNIIKECREYNTEADNTLDKIQYLINSESIIPVHHITKHIFKKKKRQQPLYIKKPHKGQDFICHICHRVLANRLTYDHHMQRHTNCRFICEQCGKGFPVLVEMQMHQLAKHGTGPYLQCDHCSYKAPRKLTLIEHLRIHTGERPFTCEKCGLTFRRQAIWRNHLVHHTEKKYQCAYCPMKFYRNSQLLEHSNNVHERLYMYVCRICNINYTKSQTVRRHMLQKHGIPREKQGNIPKITNVNSRFPAIQT